MNYFINENKNIEFVLCDHSLKSYPIHNHVSVYTIGFLLSGALELKTKTETRNYKAGDFFVLPPYAPHGITAKQPYSMLCVCIHKSLFAQKEPADITGEIAHLLRHAAILAAPQTEAFLAQLSDTITKIAAQAEISQTDHQPIIDQLVTHPEEKRSIDELAQEACTSKYQFIRNFKEDVGLTPHQFQIQNQIRKAQKALAQSENITEVAMDAGFFDQSHFIRHFEKIVQLTPTEYKASCETLEHKLSKPKPE